MPSPPLTPVRWVPAPIPSPQKSDLILERGLAFPKGTLGLLRGAFQAGLTRSEGWEPGADDGSEDLKGGAVAAAIFKRGVGFRNPLKVPKNGSSKRVKIRDTYSSQGQYDILFSTKPLLPNQLPSKAFFLLDEGFLEANPQWKRIPKEQRVTLKVSERSKSLEMVAHVLAEARRRKLTPKTPWVLMGGGILCDLGGFAASLFGAPFIMVPTTLLAMVDASLGGKTGVNFPPFGKNQVGLFSFPRKVLVHPYLLKTLPKRHWLAGGAECLKHAVLTGDEKLLQETSHALALGNQQALVTLLPRLISVKSQVVARDPSEAGERATLNLGHTLAHALEAISHEVASGSSTLLHGEAVAAGMVFALILSHRLGYLSEGQLKLRTFRILESGSCPTKRQLQKRLKLSSLNNVRFHDRVYTLILGDKKREAGANKGLSFWILVDAAGAVENKKRKSFLISVKKSEYLSAWALFTQLLAD